MLGKLSPGKGRLLGKTKVPIQRMSSNVEEDGKEGALGRLLDGQNYEMQFIGEPRVCGAPILLLPLVMAYRENTLDSTRAMSRISAPTSRLLELLQADEIDADAVSKVITFDPLLTGLVLGVATSAWTAGCAEPTSIRGAVLRLGHKRLIATVLGAAAGLRMQDSGLTRHDRRPGSQWEQTVAMALSAEGLAKLSGLVDPTDAFTAGLLTGVGKSGMAKVVSEQGEARIELARSGEISFDHAEREVRQLDHAEAGALVLEDWGLPLAIVEPVQWHHRPDQCPMAYQSMADTLHVAQYLCGQIGMVMGFGEGRMLLQQDRLDRLCLTGRDLDLAVFSIESKVDEFARGFCERRVAA